MAFYSQLSRDMFPVDTIAAHDALAAARADLFRQAQAACALGSPFVRDVLVAASRQLDRAPLLSAQLATWPGDRASAAIALRVNGALHALARCGAVPELSAVYAARGGDIERAVAVAFESADAMLAAFILQPTQTNEVRRSATLMAGLMTVAGMFGPHIELLEVGASAGLNLNLGRYAYCLGGTSAGDPASPVRIAPKWQGPAPRRHRVEIVEACGVDLAPLDPRDPDDCERLMCYVWADRDDRMEQLSAALQLARRFPPAVERGDAANWLEARLSAPQPHRITRVVMHSMVRQYLATADRLRMIQALARAGAAATADRPLAQLAFEWDEGRRKVELVLTTWPDGTRRLLAHPDPYGDVVSWLG